MTKARTCCLCGKSDDADWYCGAHGHCRRCSMKTCNTSAMAKFAAQRAPVQSMSETHNSPTRTLTDEECDRIIAHPGINGGRSVSDWMRDAFALGLERQRASDAEIARSEPELPGDPPAEVMLIWKHNPIEAMRAAVRATKKAIAAAIEAQK